MISSSMDSLQQLFSLTLQADAALRTEAEKKLAMVLFLIGLFYLVRRTAGISECPIVPDY
jgi:hypothetical protein